VIRNAVLHLASEQPLLADLYDMPVPADVSLVCTNIRSLDGKKPVFVDHADSVFVFPYLHIRFVEIPAAAAPGRTSDEDAVIAGPASANGGAVDGDGELDADIELDEDFLRRIKEV
jgi:hypothetical protein